LATNVEPAPEAEPDAHATGVVACLVDDADLVLLSFEPQAPAARVDRMTTATQARRPELDDLVTRPTVGEQSGRPTTQT
jgi:hypothetical protein